MHYCSSECGSISIMQLLILQTLLCSEIMRRTDLTASLNFKLQSTFDQFETQTLVAIWSRTLGSIADTFVIFLELILF